MVIVDIIKNRVNRENLFVGCTHFMLSTFIGMFVVAIILGDDGSGGYPDLVIFLSIFWVSIKQSFTATISIGLAWLLSEALQKPMHFTPLKFYWIFWAASWFLLFSFIF